MLAGAQSIDPKIDAIARKLPLRNVANFDGIHLPAAGVDAEI